MIPKYCEPYLDRPELQAVRKAEARLDAARNDMEQMLLFLLRTSIDLIRTDKDRQHQDVLENQLILISMMPHYLPSIWQMNYWLRYWIDRESSLLGIDGIRRISATNLSRIGDYKDAVRANIDAWIKALWVLLTDMRGGQDRNVRPTMHQVQSAMDDDMDYDRCHLLLSKILTDTRAIPRTNDKMVPRMAFCAALTRLMDLCVIMIESDS